MPKAKVIVYKYEADGTEKRIGGSYDTDQDAIKNITKPGDYIFYEVQSFTAEDLKKEDNE